ncbi:MAG: RNA methyltransferase [Elusimicrobia bacterium]|nr:RNA methyltransferase [Elusimicrobiota bacterium]
MDLRVVLVAPENPLNVGFVARAMRAFGAADLVVAASAWKTLPAEARVTGVCAPDILDGVRFESGLADALRGCGTAIAFSRRPTDSRREEFSLARSLPASLNLKGKTALVFGRESSGLTRAESALCPHLARIPCEGGVSLNLGQAVAVALFALTASGEAEPARMFTAASMDRMLALWDYLQPRLAAAPRFSETRQRRVRQMLYRLRLDDADCDALFSVMRALSPSPRPSSP